MARAATALGYDNVVVANLCAFATPSVVQLNTVGSDVWEASRVDLEVAVHGGTALLAGWGVAGLSGGARRSMGAQVDWLIECAAANAVGAMWMVGGEPRHPSRWHQYVSDKYGRTTGGTFEERLRQVLVAVPHPA